MIGEIDGERFATDGEAGGQLGCERARLRVDEGEVGTKLGGDFGEHFAEVAGTACDEAHAAVKVLELGQRFHVAWRVRAWR